jgi:hypothetical protein
MAATEGDDGFVKRRHCHLRLRAELRKHPFLPVVQALLRERVMMQGHVKFGGPFVSEVSPKAVEELISIHTCSRL